MKADLQVGFFVNEGFLSVESSMAAHQSQLHGTRQRMLLSDCILGHHLPWREPHLALLSKIHRSNVGAPAICSHRAGAFFTAWKEVLWLGPKNKTRVVSAYRSASAVFQTGAVLLRAPACSGKGDALRGCKPDRVTVPHS